MRKNKFGLVGMQWLSDGRISGCGIRYWLKLVYVLILADAAIDAIESVISTLECKNTSCLNPCPTDDLREPSTDLQIPTDTCESNLGDTFEVFLGYKDPMYKKFQNFFEKSPPLPPVLFKISL